MPADLRGADLTKLFVEEFALCAVKPGETLVVLSEPGSRQDYVAASFAAGQIHGANVAALTMPGGSPAAVPSTLTGTAYGLSSIDANRPVIELLKAADFVVDLTLESLIHSPNVGEVLREGTRMLYVCEPPDVLARNLSKPEYKAEGQRNAAKMANAERMTITSPAGTNLTAEIKDAHPGFQCGFTDDPGRWDHWPSQMVLCWPRPEQVQGTLVLDVNDVLFPFKQYIESPVTFTIKEGYITEIEGGHQARMLKDYLFANGEDAARFTSHMGWGLQRGTDWWSMAMYDRQSIMGMDARAERGNFLISTGPNRFTGRYTPFHLDIPMRSCSVTIDGTPITVDGRLVD
jgi:2,5-dihydroxypyridine 5,6-dioxygenase